MVSETILKRLKSAEVDPRTATDEEILAVPFVGKAALEEIRERYPEPDGAEDEEPVLEHKVKPSPVESKVQPERPKIGWVDKGTREDGIEVKVRGPVKDRGHVHTWLRGRSKDGVMIYYCECGETKPR